MLFPEKRFNELLKDSENPSLINPESVMMQILLISKV